MRRPLAALALTILLAAGLLAACSGPGGEGGTARGPRTAEDSLAAWRAHADSLEETLGALQQSGGKLEQAGGTAAWTAWQDGAAVVAIHEDVDVGARGSRSSRYYFEDGAPRLTVETGKVTRDTTQPPVPMERALLFDAGGRLVAAHLMLDGVKTWISTEEAQTVLERARQLLAGAEEARTAPGDAPPAGR